MSMTTEIRTLSSPLRRWFDRRLDPASIAACLAYVNGSLARIRPLVVEGTDFPLAGMAFDYSFRWLLEPLQAMAARQGALALAHDLGWEDAPLWVETLRMDGDRDPDPVERARRSIALSWFESYFRSGELLLPLKGFITTSVDNAALSHLLAQSPPATVRDVVMLLTTV